MITRIKADNFTVFTDMKMDFTPGINIIIGENGTGKTHILKALYAACCTVDEREERTFDQKLKAVFMPNSIGRLVHRSVGRASGSLTVFRKDNTTERERYITCKLTTLGKSECTKSGWNMEVPFESTFIPVKDMLANSQGFRALYASRRIHFEEIYSDILDKAYLPIPKGKQSRERVRLLNILNEAISGKVIEKKEQFYLKNKTGELEFPLLAEGFRKLGLLYALIHNETLTNGSVLFWDEPEANLNPKLAKTVVRILLELKKIGVQIFIATHDYVLLKEFELESTQKDDILYHTLFFADNGEVKHFSTRDVDELNPNAIDGTFADMMDREIQKGLKGL